jgi:RHS repeat-associated protein
LAAALTNAGVTAANTFGANGLDSRNTGGSSTFYAFDPQGNIAERIDSNQNVLTSHLFDSFGDGLASGSYPAPFGFGAQAGYYADTETGLYLLTNRYYDPAQGRFLTRDPIGYAGGIDLYAYTANDPMTWVDPLGLLMLGGCDFDPSTIGGGMMTGLAALGSAATGGLWNGGAYRCQPGFGTSKALAGAGLGLLTAPAGGEGLEAAALADDAADAGEGIEAGVCGRTYGEERRGQ